MSVLNHEWKMGPLSSDMPNGAKLQYYEEFFSSACNTARDCLAEVAAKISQHLESQQAEFDGESTLSLVALGTEIKLVAEFAKVTADGYLNRIRTFRKKTPAECLADPGKSKFQEMDCRFYIDRQGNLYNQEGRSIVDWDRAIPVFILLEIVGMQLPNADEQQETT